MRALGALALALLAGCAGGGVRPYADEGSPKNLTIRTSTSSGSAFSSVRASVHVYSVDAKCATRYLGTVDLDKPSVAAALPQAGYLVFEFATSGFLGGSRGRVSRETLVRTRADAVYEADVSYRDELYGVELRERPRGGAARELPLLNLSSCRPS